MEIWANDSEAKLSLARNIWASSLALQRKRGQTGGRKGRALGANQTQGMAAVNAAWPRAGGNQHAETSYLARKHTCRGQQDHKRRRRAGTQLTLRV